MDNFERDFIRRLAARVLSDKTIPYEPRKVIAWFQEHEKLLGRDSLRIDPKMVKEADANETMMSYLSQDLIAALGQNTTYRCSAPSRLERRLNWLGERLRLRTIERAVLGVFARFYLHEAVHALVHGLAPYSPGTASDEIPLLFLARSVDYDPKKLRLCLNDGAPLLQLGLVEDRGGRDYALSKSVQAFLRQRTEDPERLVACLVGPKRCSSLTLEDFAHMREDCGMAIRILREAIVRRRRGVNILFVGSPGTGKTEFAHLAAEAAGAVAQFVGERDKDGDPEPTRGSRIAALALMDALGGRTGGIVSVVDEADDIFCGVDTGEGSYRRGSKVFMNRLVECISTPTIWITNNPERIGEPIIRRMAFVLNFPKAGTTIRARIVARAAARHRVKLTSAEIQGLARAEVVPAILDGALRTAKRIGGGAATVHVVTEAAQRAISGPRAPAFAAPMAFDPTLSEADQNLATLADAVAKSPTRAMSFCFSGPPGTGKSAYARHLAERLGLDVLEKRSSDLLSMYVGGSEKAIAAAFEEAADTGAFLILDEADSLLRDRGFATRSWEITQVNEMLTWMERHPQPFACTTNAIDAFDPATLRRFLFKVRFLPMTSAQIASAFRQAFGVAPPQWLLRIENLTPGDFAVVIRKASVMGLSDPTRAADWLKQESDAKPGARRPIGFAA
ncbi:MAG: AAA family ATPase [Methylacidiphilales bacterium]|nr:AAA family ATPase [Candidatus Methylacidiphilales bacterium]